MREMRGNKFSPLSERAGTLRPGQRLLCSTAAGWTSALLQTYEQPGSVEQYDTAPSPDPLIVMVLKGSYEMESFSGGMWKRAAYAPGTGGVTAAHTSNRLRWHSRTAFAATVLRLYIPPVYFVEASEEYRRAGERSSVAALDQLSFTDPMVCSVLTSLAQAASRGAPDLYADAGARFLAIHLLSMGAHWSQAKLARNPGSELTDRRLTRVLDFMQHHCASDLTLNQLASEAAISRFHFSRLFKAKLGVTPHQHLVQLRMRKARELLRHTNYSIGEIAIMCGYCSPGHFAAAFLRSCNVTPSAFRTLRSP